MGKRTRWILAAIALVAVAIGLAGYSWLGSDDARARLETILSNALHRDVTIAGLELDARHGAIELRGVEISNPEGWDGVPMLRAQSVRLDADLDDALDGKLVGKVQAEGLELRVAKRDGVTNLHGLRRKGGRGASIDLHLQLNLTDSHVLLEDLDRGEQLELDGVRLAALLSNREEGRDVAVDVEVDTLSVRGVGLHDVEVSVVGSDETIEVQRLHARVGDRGELEAKGAVRLEAETPWTLDVRAKGVGLDEDLLPIVVAFHAGAAGFAATPDARVEGTLDAVLELRGNGFVWPTLRPLLAGRGSVTTRDLVLPEASLAVRLAALAGREPSPWALGTTTAHVTIGNGWVDLGRVDNEGAAVHVPVTGRVALDGALDLDVDLFPLVEAYGGGVYATVARTTTSLPMRVEGTVEQPELKPPKVSAVAKGLVGGLIHRALGE